ncbi:CPBP family intramembrane metalloprotease [Erythrobacter sp. SDW2]|uniref:CPBP family intramembrane glutamic endopeptidase n=1 Tax=Erythrobacter sp. SDW2 TaxID=2907154 RepID=UPI001F28FFEC|nr:type II CAAX endopeptidase family protein [Erythrobacter sp. SDW2]UIP07962.1 CPBP family intramembrane metalloprotease [Erythrobacter sp. SDW2]
MTTLTHDQPLSRRVLDFPLVTMIAAGALVLGTTAGLGFVVARLLEKLGMAQGAAGTIIGVVLHVLVLFGLYKLVIRNLGARKHDDLPLAGALRDLGLGGAGAFALMTLIVGLAAVLGVYRIEGWGGMQSWLWLLFIAGINAAFFEELLFRGVLFRWLEEFAGSWAALLVSSAMFGALHIGNPGASWFSSFAIAMEAGILLGGAYMLTRSLWAPIGIHFGWNVTQGLVWDVPVSGIDVDGLVNARLGGNPIISGEPFGLEASIIALVVATTFGIWLVKLAMDRGEVMKPWWSRA